MHVHTHLLALLAAAPAALAQAPTVAIVASAASDPTDCRFTDVRDALSATGAFAAVDIVDCVASTPSLADLAPYDSLLNWSNVDYHDADALGDVLADYSDAGGGVVVAVFSHTSSSPARRLGGRWITGGYEVVEAAQGTASTSSTLGATLVSGHPLMAGVQTIVASTAFRPEVSTTVARGTAIAEWNDGSVIAAVGDIPTRVDLGVYPPSSNCSPGFWEATGDGGVLVTNALLLTAAGGPPIGAAYCTSTVNSTGAAAQVAALGSTHASIGSVTLAASNLPPQSFAYFLTSRERGFVAAPGGSAGDLCLGGAIGRFIAPGEVLQVSAGGEASLAVELSNVPTPIGPVAVVAGDTWCFQAWYRDVVAGSSTSNFTNAVEVVFD